MELIIMEMEYTTTEWDGKRDMKVVISCNYLDVLHDTTFMRELKLNLQHQIWLNE